MVIAIRISAVWRLAVVVALVCVRPSPAAAQPTSEAQVRAAVEAGAYDRAEQLARGRVLELAPRLGQSAPEVQAGEQLLVETLILNGRGAQRATLDLARRLAQPALDGRSPPIQSVVALGDALVSASEYGEAVKVLTAAMSAVQNQSSSDPSARAEVQYRLGRALVYDGRASEALAVLDRSLAYRRGQGVAGPLADALLAMAWAHQRAGNYTAAGVAIRQALRLRESTPDHPGYADVLSLLGLQLWFEGDLTAAREMSTTAVAVAERTVRPDHPILALALMRLGATLLDFGDVAESLLIKQRALAIAERTYGPAHYETWAYINGLAEGLRSNGDYTAARGLYLRALAIAEGRFGATHDSVATTVHNLALVDARLGDYIKARSEQARAIGIWERLLGPDHPFVAVALTELAAVYRAQGEAGNALPMLRRALRIRTRSLGPAHREVSKTFADVAAAYLDLDRLAEADAAIRRALEIWGTTAGPETPDFAAMLDLMARIQAARGQLSDAQASYERALAIWNTSVGRLHPAYAEAQAGLAITLARMGRFDAAGAAAAEAEDAGRTHLRLMLRSLPERQALRYAITRPGGLGVLLSLASMSPSAAIRGYDRLVGSRALVLDEMTFRRATADMSPEARELYDRLTVRRRRLANLVVSGLATAAPRGFAPLLDGTRGEVEALETELADRSATFTTNTRRASIGLAEVRAALPTGTALVSFSRYERTVVTPAANATYPATARTVPSYIAFVLRAGGGEPVAVPLGSAAAVEGAITAWRDELLAGVARQPVNLVAAERALRVSGAALRRRIWDPIATQLEGARRVFVVPDSAINLVPIAALPASRGGYLLERGPVIHYLSAERDLAAPEPARAAAPGTLLAVGGPAFSTREVFASAAPKPVPAPAPRPEAVIATRGTGVASTCVGFRTMTFDPLPAARAEAEEVAALWTSSSAGAGEPARTLVGTVASEASFKQLAPGRRVLHLATHGFYLGDECDGPLPQNTRAVGGLVSGAKPAAQAPAARLRARRVQATPENPLLLSGLAFAGANRRSAAGADEDDGILTADEVAGLDLTGLDWAVLSACDTGLGVVRVGEGVLGLRRAFQMAGAHTVIMSVWSVEDRSTRQWMRALYSGRFERGLDTADAVHQAALSTLHARRSATGSGHPFFWAGFVAAGDWR